MNSRYIFAGGMLLLIPLIFFLPYSNHILSRTGTRMRSFASALIHAPQQNQQIERLQGRVAFLEKQLFDVDHLQKEEALKRYDALRSDQQLLTAFVIGKGIFLGSQALILDAGSKDGAKEGSPVVASHAKNAKQDEKGLILVGRIAKVLPNLSYVLLLSDISFKIPGKTLQGDIGGIIKGGLGNQVTFGEILQGLPLAKEEIIITDNDDPQVPAGILIGTIDTILSSPTDLVQRTSITTFSDPAQLDAVGVILTNV